MKKTFEKRGKRLLLAVLAAALFLPFLLSGCAVGESGEESGLSESGLSGTEAGESDKPSDNAEETEIEPMKTKRVILLAGQSNAVGHTLAKFLPDSAGKISPARVEEMKKGYPNIRMMFSTNPFQSAPWENTQFEPVTFGLGLKSANVTFGPEVGMAEYLNKAFPGEEFYIIKCASSGASLYGDWNPNMVSKHTNLCRQMTEFVKTALAELEKDGSRAEIVAFCWMQGESDSDWREPFYNDPKLSGYEGLFRKLVEKLEAEFSDFLPEKGLAVIQAGISTYWKKATEINAAKKAFTEKRENSYFFQTYDLTWNLENNDNAHYDSAAMVTLGNRFGEYIEKALS